MAETSLNLATDEIQSIYTSDLMTGFQKMRERRQLCDIILVCGGTEFPVHRVIMCAGSPYCEGLLTQTGGNLPPRIELPEIIEPPALNVILTFLYSGSIKDLAGRVDLLSSVLTAAQFFQISIVYDYCCNAAMTSLTVETFADIWCLADKWSNKAMVPKLMVFAGRNLTSIIATGSFLMLDIRQLLPLLEQVQLRQLPTDLITRGILNWINFNISARQRHLPALFAIIDLRLLSSPYLKILVKDVDIVKTSSEVYDHLVAIAMDRLHLEAANGFQNLRMICFTYNDGAPAEEWQYNLETQTWLPKKALPMSLAYGTVATFFHGFVYFFGGGSEPREASDLVQIYNVEQNAVVFVSKMKTRRFRSGVAVYQSQLYVVGGANASGNLRGVERYDPGTNVWSEVGATSVSHLCPNLVVAQNTLFVVGSWHCWNVERYNNLTDTWTVITSVPSPVTHIWPTAATCFGNIYVIRDMHEKMFHVFDPPANRWRVLPFETVGDIGIRDVWNIVNGSTNEPLIFGLNANSQVLSLNCREGKVEGSFVLPHELSGVNLSGVKRSLTLFAQI